MSRVTSKVDRPRRQSVGKPRDILTVKGKETGFEYRIVNDSGDRVKMFEEHGWEVVQDQGIKVGDRRVANPLAEGSPVKVSVGGGQQAYVMRIRKDWYEEDQQAKQDYVDRTEEAMKADAKRDSDYGKLETKRD